MKRLRGRAWGIIFFVLTIGLVHGIPDAKAGPPMNIIPAYDHDLQEIIDKSNRILEFSTACDAGLECPELEDCDIASDLLRSLNITKDHMQAMSFWMEKAFKDHADHFTSLAEQSIITGDNMANAQHALAWQEFLHNLGSALLEVASVSKTIEDALKDPEKLQNTTMTDFLENLDSVYEGLKDLEGGAARLAKGVTASDSASPTPLGDMTPEALGIDRGTLNDAKSTISDMKTIIQEAAKHGKDWRAALKGGNVGAAVGQIVGRYAKAYSESQIKERKNHINDLVNNLRAEDRARAEALENKQRVSRRRDKAEEAFSAAKQAYRAFVACISKYCSPESMFHTQIPDFGADTQRESWGMALNYFNQKIPELSGNLDKLPSFRDKCKAVPPISLHSDGTQWCTFGGSTTRLFIPIAPLLGSPGEDTRDRQKGSPGDDIISDTGPSGPAGFPVDTPGVPGAKRTTSPVTGTSLPGSKPGDTGETDTPEKKKEPPMVTLNVIVKAKASVLAGGRGTAIPETSIKLEFVVSGETFDLPGPGKEKIDKSYDESPRSALLGGDNPSSVTFVIRVPASSGIRSGDTLEQEVPTTPTDSKILQLNGETPPQLHKELFGYVTSTITLSGNTYVVLQYPAHMADQIGKLIKQSPGIVMVEINFCREKQGRPDDPYFQGSSSWGQKHDDQWAIKRTGFTGGSDSAWNALGKDGKPVVVAVVDSGLDWNHRDISWDNIWNNEDEIPDNGIDDDRNGYVDDIIGWDFYGNTNKPRDLDGHGTFVAGLIAATRDNGVGIAGINPFAKIMVLKALNNFGHTRASYVAQAIIYAANNGARVINVSVGGKNRTTLEQKAIEYAVSKGALIVVAAGNEGVSTDEFGPGGVEEVITVGATDMNDKRSVYSNWGLGIDIAAPGDDVLSLRARRTDLMRDIPGVKYIPGEAYVGKDKRYYRASGTSFAAPIVSGAASVLLSMQPGLTNIEVKRMLIHSARDVEAPGYDQFTGYGLLDARAAVMAQPGYYLAAKIESVRVIKEGGQTFIGVFGSAEGSNFKKAEISVGRGDEPRKWTTVTGTKSPVIKDRLGLIPAKTFKEKGKWTIRLQTFGAKGKVRECRWTLTLN